MFNVCEVNVWWPAFVHISIFGKYHLLILFNPQIIHWKKTLIKGKLERVILVYSSEMACVVELKEKSVTTPKN